MNMEYSSMNVECSSMNAECIIYQHPTSAIFIKILLWKTRNVKWIWSNQVYTPWPANMDALEANLRREVALLDPGMIRRAIFDMRVRAHKCIANQAPRA